MTVVVYYIRDGENEELRYSLRSVEKYLNPEQVIVVGGRPKWLTNVEHIPTNQNGNKYHNAQLNVKTLLNSSICPAEFIRLNDDHFILSKTELLQNFHSGNLQEWLKNHQRLKHGLWFKTLANTFETLQQLGVKKEILNYELHYPKRFNKYQLQETYKIIENHSQWTLAPQTVHGNLFKNNATFAKDVKIFKPEHVPKGRESFISTNDFAFKNGIVGQYLKQRFPHPSKYEQ